MYKTALLNFQKIYNLVCLLTHFPLAGIRMISDFTIPVGKHMYTHCLQTTSIPYSINLINTSRYKSLTRFKSL